LMSALFLKNSIICIFWVTMVPYIPGTFTILLTLLNRKDKDIYFPLRGDSGGGENGFHAAENFRMVAQAEKKAHCLVWARPSQYNSAVAMGYLSFAALRDHFYANQQLIYCPFTSSTTWSFIMPLNLSSAGLMYAFFLGFMFTGYHYKYIGGWFPRDTSRPRDD